MPYDKRYDKKRKKWVVFKKGEPSRVFGTHPNEGAANRQLAALYASEKDKAK